MMVTLVLFMCVCGDKGWGEQSAQKDGGHKCGKLKMGIQKQKVRRREEKDGS